MSTKTVAKDHDCHSDDVANGLRSRMPRSTTDRFDLLLLTNGVERGSSQFEEVLAYFSTHSNVPSIIVAREPMAFREHLLVLDGNHRVVACACLGRAVRIFEIDKDPHRVFACSFAEFARICGEDHGRGAGIARELQNIGVLELVKVHELQGGESFAHHKSRTRKFTYWRFARG